jgi:hypothetical protein
MAVDTLTDVIDLEMEGTGDDEAEDSPITYSQRTIRTQSADPEVDSLYNRWKRGRLILQPFFQRQYVWDRAKASRLIESSLLAIPLPIIYLAQELDGRDSVIDGQQRLTSFCAFIDGKFPSGEPFRLSSLRVLRELERKTFAELDETMQDRIRNSAIRAVTIMNDSDPELKFEIFERLNTGSVPLNDMELRNCVYYGPYMELLKELAADPDFKQLVGFKGPDTRMRDIELVLRFAAFYHASYLRYQSPMKKFLNDEIRKYRAISKEEAEELRRAFKNAVQIVKSLFGDKAFRRFNRGTENAPNGAWETTRFNASLYDVLMGTFAMREKNQVYAALDVLREGLIDLMTTNQEFIDAILLGTSQVQRVVKRFDLTRHRVDTILSIYPQQPRLFTAQFKQQLFDNDPTCQICHQRIQQIDDAAVDHIEQYWRGGPTIEANGRLAHRYCNMARPRND